MQVTEKVSDGLHREFEVLVSLADLDAKLLGQLTEMAPRVQLKGFRPGKVPVSFLRKTYGKSLMSEIVEKTVNESSDQVLKERSLKPASLPQVNFLNGLEDVVEGKSDLQFSLAVDLMPEFELADLGSLEVERLTAEVSDEEVGETLKRFADSQRTFEPKQDGAVAENGDAVTIDFEGKQDGVPFEGGKGTDFDLVLGSGSFIPGFEDQLVGVKAGDARVVDVTFPESYGAANLAGKPAQFDVTVKAVKVPVEAALDDELAKKLGLESLAILKDRIRDNLKDEHARASRVHMKRRILDSLDAVHRFELPPAMVEQEFTAIWNQLEAELKREGKTPEDEGKTEDELRKEYREIAERRVRLGLVLTKIGEQNGLTVTQDEMNRAIQSEAMRFPNQQQQVFQYFANNPQALAAVRAPLFEDKVVDFLSELVKVNDRAVAKDILFLDPDDASEKLAAGGTDDDKSKAKPKAKAKKKD